MKSAYRWIGLGLGILALIYFLNFAVTQISSFPKLHWGMHAYASLIGATIASVMTILIAGYAWLLLLRTCGEAAIAREVLIVFVLAQFAKYIPGNVAHHAGRIVLARSRGFTLSRVVFTMTLEAGWLIVAASTTAAIWLLITRNNLFGDVAEMPSVPQLALATIIAIAFPLLSGWVLFRWHPGPLRKIFSHADVNTPSPIVLLNCFLIYVFCFLLMGFASDILARGLFEVKKSRIGLLTGAFAVAWVAGFLTPGAPAGLGVRETILLAVLGPTYGDGIAVWLAVSLRAVTTLADALTFIFALIAGRKSAVVPHASRDVKTENMTRYEK